MNKIKELIEKESGVKLIDFPESDYEKISKYLQENGKTEVWLMRGLGRGYLVPVPEHNDWNFPIMYKLCDLVL